MIDPQDPYAPPMGTTTSHDENNGSQVIRKGNMIQMTGQPPELSKGETISRAASSRGLPVTGADIDDQSMVSISGIPMRLKDALVAGLVEKSHDGQYHVTKGRKTETKQQGMPDSSPLEGLSADIEQGITQVAQSASPEDVIGVISHYSTHGEVNEASLGRIASRMGIEPHEAHSRFESLRGAFEQQARAAFSSAGADPDSVIAWAWEHNPKAMQEAIKTQATQRSTKGYKEIAKGYMADLDQLDPNSILSAQFPEGVTARRDRSGKVYLNIKGMEVGWKEAHRRGLVKVSKR